MKNISENIITINGTSENLFDKAIFVLKPESVPDPNSLDFVKEADKILNNYMLKAVSELQSTKPTTNIIVQNNPLKRRAIAKKPTKLDRLIDRLLAFAILSCGVVVMSLLMVM